MKIKLFLTIALMGSFSICFGQQDSTWDTWSWLIGEWKGEGNGQTGQGGGTFSFEYGLDKKIIQRKSHSEYPANGNKALIIHDDLMIIYLDIKGKPSNAIYFDNEGHIINYTISYSENAIVMLSEKITNTPVFRLTYNLIEKSIINTKFEMSQDGVNFMTYVEGKSEKTK